MRNLSVHSFLLFFPIMLLTSGGEIRAQVALDSHAGTKAEVEHVLGTQQEAWNRHDLEGFMAGYWNSAELTFFSGAKENHGWQATLDRYRATYAVQGTRWGSCNFPDCRSKRWGRILRLCAVRGS